MRNTSTKALLTVALATAVMLLCSACGGEGGNYGGKPVFHCPLYDLTPDSIDLRTGVVLRAMPDSTLQVRVEGNLLRTLRPDPPVESRGAFSFSSGMPLFDLLVAEEQSRPLPETYSPLLPYELWLNPFVGAEGNALLTSRVKHGYLVPQETRRYGWPVINENPQWLLAACELYNNTADPRLLRRIGEVAENVIGEECRVALDSATGLVTGVPRYLAMARGVPAWMGPTQLSGAASLTVNVTYWAALQAMNDITSTMAKRNEKSHLPDLPLDADTLLRSIHRRLWLPNIGCFSAMLYGNSPSQIPLHAADNLGQGVAVVAGMPLEGMSRALVAKTSFPYSGVTLFSPRLGAWKEDPSQAEALARTLWPIAAARTGNDKAYNASLGALVYGICNDILADGARQPLVRQPLSTVVLRGFFGIAASTDGLYFSPCVPSGMPGTKTVSRLHYRRCELTLTLHGVGNTVQSFAIDGKETAPFFPASLEGRHRIDITLAPDPIPSSQASITEPGYLPAPPQVEWNGEGLLATVVPSALGAVNAEETPMGEQSMLYINGTLTDVFSSRSYELFKSTLATTVQFATVADSRWIGFTDQPHTYIPQGSCITVNLAQVVKGGTKIIQDKRLAARFVESDRWKNARIAMEVEVAKEGTYSIDVHYLQGLGIVNSRRRTALRTLEVDDVRRGVLVFPQLSASDWESDSSRDWQTRTAFTNPLRVHLTPGRHKLRLLFYQPSPVYVDPLSNMVLADFVRLLRVEE